MKQFDRSREKEELPSTSSPSSRSKFDVYSSTQKHYAELAEQSRYEIESKYNLERKSDLKRILISTKDVNKLETIIGNINKKLSHRMTKPWNDARHEFDKKIHNNDFVNNAINRVNKLGLSPTNYLYELQNGIKESLYSDSTILSNSTGDAIKEQMTEQDSVGGKYSWDESINLQGLINIEISKSEFTDEISKKETSYIESWEEAQNSLISMKEINEEGKELTDALSKERTLHSKVEDGQLIVTRAAGLDLIEESKTFNKERIKEYKEYKEIYEEKIKSFEKTNKKFEEYTILKEEIERNADDLVILVKVLSEHIKQDKTRKLDTPEIERVHKALQIEKKYQESLETLKKWSDIETEKIKDKVHYERMTQHAGISKLNKEMQDEGDREKRIKKYNEIRRINNITNSKEKFYAYIVKEVFMSLAQPIAKELLKNQNDLLSTFRSQD